ncbi:hypothetical protein [Sorangium sp. So ce1153]
MYTTIVFIKTIDEVRMLLIGCGYLPDVGWVAPDELSLPTIV